MATKNQLTNAPKCPVHNRPMKRLPALPALKVGRGVTQFKITLRREFDAVLRFRCTIPGCPCVASTSKESAE